MWVIIFKLDGETIHQLFSRLSGEPSYFFSPGSHGNIGTGMGRGSSRNIPFSVGEWDTTIQHIVISDPNSHNTIDIPGIVGCFTMLMEENLTPNQAVEAGHQALNDMFKTELKKFIDEIDLQALAVEVRRIVANEHKSQEEATILVFKQHFDSVKDILERYAPSVVRVAIEDRLDVLGWVGSAIDKDKPMGHTIHIFTQDELLKSIYSWPVDPLEFTDEMDGPGPVNTREGRAWAYNLHGTAFPHAYWKPLRDEIYPQDVRELEVSCIEKKKVSDRRGVFWIHHIGGTHGGKEWRMYRNTAYEKIRRGEKSFFVRASDGSKTPVIIKEYYLTTHANNRPEDNLGNLHYCPWAELVFED
jgi:hypothetical protein